MTDKELLGFAAKAAGLILLQVPNANQTDADWWAYSITEKPNTAKVWSPLIDDGDALRLAVKLGFRIDTPKYKGFGTTCGNQTVFRDCPFVQTRLAIVKYAAEIGKAMA